MAFENTDDRPRPLGISDLGGVHHYDGLHVLLGGRPGPIGGGSGLALIFGILLLLFTRVVSWIFSLAAVGTLLAGLYISNEQNIGVQMLSGYTLLGIFFLAANPVTAPRSKRGKFLGGMLFALLELFLRKATPLSEGTFLSVPAIQCLTVLFDQYIAPPKEESASASGGEMMDLDRL